MEDEGEISLAACFSDLEDPRIERCKKHELTDIVMISICAVICSAESWIDIEDWGKSKLHVLRQFIELRNGIPSHDTIARVFSRLDPKKFQECFSRWITKLRVGKEGEVIAIDGKTMRGSYDHALAQSPLHLVSAWASSRNVSLGQVCVAEKSNEITAIPELLGLLEIAGCVVTIDAMGCQKNIAASIREKKADYLLALKGNHKNLHDDVKTFFETARTNGFEKHSHTFVESTDGEHGRIETRRCWSTDDIAWLGIEDDWKDITSISMIECTRTIPELGTRKEKSSTEIRFYLSSLPADAARIARAAREHWSIENSLHWILDVTFDEDRSRIRKDRAPENFSVLRKITIGLLKNAQHKRKSVKGRRKIAAWNENFVLQVIFGQQIEEVKMR